jgi:hypothetical protein
LFLLNRRPFPNPNHQWAVFWRENIIFDETFGPGGQASVQESWNAGLPAREPLRAASLLIPVEVAPAKANTPVPPTLVIP